MEPMVAREYAETHHGGMCPWCLSRDIEGVKGIEADGDAAWQHIHCQDCEREWDDIYKLTGYEARGEA